LNQKINSAIAVASANIALIKYWGKRDAVLNLPAVGSISLTLEALRTKTKVTYKQDLSQDQLIINNMEAPEKQRIRVQTFLDLIRKESGFRQFAEVISENNFPTGAGLASSASAFAALSMAATRASGQKLNKNKLSQLSRIGSGSAARSIFGGFVEMKKGTDPLGKEDFAVKLAPENYWDLRVIILITSLKEKIIGSTEAMNLTAKTSPYYKNWVNSSDRDLEEMKTAIRTRDSEKLGDLAEYSALKMHALTLTSRPAIIYWNSTTLKLIAEVRAIRNKGIPVYFTIDAGPQVKIITLAEYANTIKEHFLHFEDIQKCIESKLGPDVKLTGDNF
jgi:diphosphomevalonate decarboxylase